MSVVDSFDVRNLTSEAWSYKPGSHMSKDEAREVLPTLSMSERSAESASSNPPATGTGTPAATLPPGTTSFAAGVRDVQSAVAGST